MSVQGVGGAPLRGRSFKASVCCVVSLFVFAALCGAATAGASVHSSHSASRTASCSCGKNHAVSGAAKACSRKKAAHKRCKRSTTPKGAQPPKSTPPPVTRSAPEDNNVLEEQPPVTGHEQPALPGSPVETKSPEAESPIELPVTEAPVEAEPPAETETKPPVEPEPPVETKPPVEPEPPVETKPPVEPEPPVETKPPVEPEPPVETKPPVEPEPTGETSPFRFFAPTSFWNELVPAGAAVDQASSTIVAVLNEEELAEESAKHGPMINTTSWSVPIYTVPSNQPTVRIALVKGSSAALQAAWTAVPLPSNAQPAVGSDGHLVVWQPSKDRMWEFWRLEKVAGAWQASWGGAMQEVSKSYGVYGPEAWLGAKTSWGASASSLPIVGGLITLEDLKRGKINHALALSVPNTRYGAYASPAQRTDGGTPVSSALPEGAHLRLDPALNLASLHLSPFTLMLAEAAQRYGIFIRDTASDLAFYAQDPIPTGTEPYAGAHGYFEGQSPAKLLGSFPWSHLQVLDMELHASAG